MIRFVILFSAFITFAYSEDCDVRNFPDGTVCVCSANYCDTVPSLDVSIGKYQVYSTSKSKLGFSSKTGLFSTQDPAQNVDNVKVDRSIKHQTIIGFGGAFTDSTGINIQSLPTEAQDKLMESYFGKSGIEYNLGRVPIGGTDFSTRAYSYDDFPLDTTLMKFALQPEDLNYKIPFIRKANILTNNKLNLFASAWTAPPWMKTNNDWHGIGFLQTKYYQLWADYMIKFLEVYDKSGISFWGLTTQNEPIDGFLPKALEKLSSMGWTPAQMALYVSSVGSCGLEPASLANEKNV
ncbi:hypothetical protein NQ314_009752 [Rhamnusium bicolor]|uniref:Glucosylceramidase n=1 Tax=Rhamnusium bicolor TaxID=1586634 RepID=A0AAV8XWG0_9CUCU|nr:hypothetical protein NQ314_009752 [Rhamnusium bicolor]